MHIKDEITDTDALSSCTEHFDGAEKILKYSLTIISKTLFKNFVSSVNDSVKSERLEMGKRRKYDGSSQMEKFNN